MISANDPVESFFNSVRSVKRALSSLELHIQRIAGDFDLKFHFPLHCLPSDDRKKGLFLDKSFLPIILRNSVVDCHKSDLSRKKALKNDSSDGDIACMKCFNFGLTWAVMLNSCIPSIFKVDKNQPQCKPDKKKSNGIHEELVKRYVRKKEGNKRFDCFIRFIFEQFSENLHKLERKVQEHSYRDCNTSLLQFTEFDNMKDVGRMLKGKATNINCFLENLNFARMGGIPSNVGMGSTSSEKKESSGYDIDGGREEPTADILRFPLSNVEGLRATISTLPLAELIDIIPHLGRPSNDHPDKKILFSVQDFFKYTKTEGRRFFEELDRDGDGQITIKDLEIAMKKRKLPHKYAREFMRTARCNFFSKSFGWNQFLSLMEQKEPTILRAYTTLCLSKSGTLKKTEILTSLKKASLPANEDNAIAMMHFLNDNTEESISYGHFRNFMLLLPSERLQDDPRNIWFEAATMVAVAPPVEIRAGGVLWSALAGGLASMVSTALLYPVDTMKTRVQASTQSFPEIISKIPEIGIHGLYKGSVPAILGQFSSHGIRTGIFEASKLVLVKIAPTIPEIQVQSLASFCSSLLGTAVRIPCEVLKQRMQAGLFSNLGEAIVSTWEQDGLKGFFRGTSATLCREVPFYVAGMGIYAESKKGAEHMLGRELQPWEMIVVGAISGGVAAVITTPFDVMKTRMMTAEGGTTLPMSKVAFSILGAEGPLGLFKGAVPRFFWIAPLGAMNFAGYELARTAMHRNLEEKH